MEKAREFQRNIYFCFIDYAKAFDWVDHNKLWKILKEMGIPDHLTYLFRILYAGQEATVRTGHGTKDWFHIGKGVHHEKRWAGRSTSWNQDCRLLLLSCFSHVWLCVTPEMAAHQAPPSLGFSRQEHGSGLPFSSSMHESEKWKWSRLVVSDS